MTTGERVARLVKLGYSEREASFLVVAALHSGYFLRRQYLDFLGSKSGYPDAALVEKAIAKGHAEPLPAFQKTLVYHLCSRSLYGAIDDRDNRHRRPRPPFAVKVKLMALDYVLGERGRSFLATEDEKVRLFAERLEIRIEKLPGKLYRSRTSGSTTRRYFVEKFPISVDTAGNVGKPIVSFSYIDEGVIATPALETFLRDHRDLFHALGTVRLVFVTTRKLGFAAVERSFQRFLDRSHHESATRCHAPERVLAYFRLEHLFRTRQFDQLDAVKLDELRRMRQEFRGPKIESLFERWCEAGDEVVSTLAPAQAPVPSPIKGEIVQCRLDHDYGFLAIEGTR